MKLTLEPVSGQETEIIIKGDLASPEVEGLLSYIKSKNNTGKLILFKEDEQFLVDAIDVIYFEVSQGKIQVHTTSGDFTTNQKLYELTDMLKNLSFAQISKSVVVNINFVKSVAAEFSGNYSLKLKTGKEILTISRKYMKEFKSKI